MVSRKYLLSSLILISFSIYAATSDTFDQGVDFANQNKPNNSVIGNSVLESTVGINNINQAVANQDSIQNTMGGNYKNIDAINNSGNNKATQCVGKTTNDCAAYNFYNDPLTRQKQQGVESAIGVASDLINKTINQNVNITEFCSTHPNDAVCVMCRKDPSQPMCQNGNKCTTITYNSNSTSTNSQDCQIIGHRSYSCKKWVDNVTFHNNYIPPNPLDGTVVSSGVLQVSLKPYSYINNAATINANLRMVAYSDYTRGNLIKLMGTISSYPNNSCGTDSKTIELNISFNQPKLQIYDLWFPSGFRCQTEGGSHLSIEGGCTDNNCTYVFTARVDGHYYRTTYPDKSETKTMTFSFTKPQVERYERVVDQVVWKDNCTY